MKLHFAVISCLLATGFAGQATAQSNCNQANGLANLTALLSEKTVCAALGGDRWQEYHKSGGDLIDWKMGAGHPTDPTKKVGTWSVSRTQIGNSGNFRETVTYDYGGGNSFTYYVCQASSTSPYTFSATTGSTTITGATLLDGQVACTGAAAANAKGKSTH